VLGALGVLATAGRRRFVRIERVDGTPARTSWAAPALERAGFCPDYRGLTLEPPRHRPAAGTGPPEGA
jgi:hypothetical protein